MGHLWPVRIISRMQRVNSIIAGRDHMNMVKMCKRKFGSVVKTLFQTSFVGTGVLKHVVLID